MTALEARLETHQVSTRIHARPSHEATNRSSEDEDQANGRNTWIEDLSPLMSAVTRGHIRIVEALLGAGADPNERNRRDGTCLEIAALKGFQSIVECLLKFGADVNAVGTLYRNALHAASAHDQAEVVGILLGHGASVAEDGRFHYDSNQGSATMKPVRADQDFSNDTLQDLSWSSSTTLKEHGSSERPEIYFPEYVHTINTSWRA